MKSWLWGAALACVMGVMAAGQPLAADETFELAIENHRFAPEQLVVPPGIRVKLRVHNKDATPEEFESYTLKREKIIPGGGTVTIYIGPLAPGTYEFVGEFHEDTAKGRIIVR